MDVSSQQHPFLLGIRFKNTKSTCNLNTNNFAKLSLLDIQNIISPSTSPPDRKIMQPLHSQVEFTQDTIDEYAIYTMIENHMNISAELYRLNKEGQEIIKEIGTKKLKLTPLAIISSKVKKPISTDSVSTDVFSLYMGLVDIVNFNRTCADAYTDLISMLDNVMFSESHDMNTFYVNEKTYNLESLYYKQETWMSEIEWYKKQTFIFSNQPTFDLGECSHILMFLNDYHDILKKISEDMEYFEKVLVHTTKILVKISSTRSAMYSLVRKHLDED